MKCNYFGFSCEVEIIVLLKELPKNFWIIGIALSFSLHTITGCVCDWAGINYKIMIITPFAKLLILNYDWAPMDGDDSGWTENSRDGKKCSNMNLIWNSAHGYLRKTFITQQSASIQQEHCNYSIRPIHFVGGIFHNKNQYFGILFITSTFQRGIVGPGCHWLYQWAYACLMHGWDLFSVLLKQQ